MKDIEPAVAHAIQTYQQTSRLKLHRRLLPENTKVISDAVVQNGEAELLISLMKKRDHYTARIHELLNNAGEQTDPGLIDDRAEAEHYITKRVLKDSHKVASIRALIEKHARFQDQYKEELLRVEQVSQPKKQVLKGLAKLSAMKDLLAAKEVLRRESALQELYQKAAATQRALGEESVRTLRTLGVPFFAATGEVPEDDKVFVLELLQSQLSVLSNDKK